MSLLKRIAVPADTRAPLTPLLDEHLEKVGGGANPGPGCSHNSSGCGQNHDSRTTCQR